MWSVSVFWLDHKHRLVSCCFSTYDKTVPATLCLINNIVLIFSFERICYWNFLKTLVLYDSDDINCNLFSLINRYDIWSILQKYFTIVLVLYTSRYGKCSWEGRSGRPETDRVSQGDWEVSSFVFSYLWPDQVLCNLSSQLECKPLESRNLFYIFLNAYQVKHLTIFKIKEKLISWLICYGFQLI